jgi:hypothetical protein
MRCKRLLEYVLSRMTPEEIRSRYRALWRTVRRLEGIYNEFNDAPAERWRSTTYSSSPGTMRQRLSFRVISRRAIRKLDSLSASGTM